MALKKNKTGSNMYPWVTHMHEHLGGECPHKCKYCYVDHPVSGRPSKYCGPLSLFEHEFEVCYGGFKDTKTIFIEYMNDLFANAVSEAWINRIIAHCCVWPENTYVFQTKNPSRYLNYLDKFLPNSILGTTIETNRIIEGISEAPTPESRWLSMRHVSSRMPTNFKLFVTIEPVLAFDVKTLASWIGDIHPHFLNLGADSKSHNLPEPTVKDVMDLVEELKQYGVELREKHNLARLKQK